MKYLLLIGCLSLSLQFTRANEVTPADSSAAGNNFSGKVVETMNTAGYTYVLVDTGSKKLWAAAPQFNVQVGDPVQVAAEMPMLKYHSKSLNRDFDLIYFANRIGVSGQDSAAATLPPGHPALSGKSAADLPAGHPPLGGQTVKPKVDLTGIKRAAGGQTIQEIFAGKTTLAGQPIAVRGKVVKYNAMILGKNWLHIRDGSGSDASHDNDLAITTAAATKVGDTVLVSGNVSTNRDFGGGYKYSLIIEDAKLTVE